MSYLLGIDAGSSRTSAAVVRLPAGDVETVDLGDGDGVAPVLHLGTDGILDVGRTAEEWARTEPERVVGGFAQRIGEPTPPILLAGEPWAPEELTAWLVRWVVDRVAQREGGPAAEIALAHPTSWADDRTRLLADALAEQDLDVTFVPAAQAVVLEHAGAPGSAVAVHDVDSGDVAVLRIAPNGGLPEVLGAEGGVGLDLEELAFTQLDIALPDADPTLPALRRAVAAAAEALGTGNGDAVPVAAPGDDRPVVLHRADLAALLRPRVQDGAAALSRVLAAAGLIPHDLTAVLLSGAWTALAAEVVPQPAVPVERDAAARGAALSLMAVPADEGDADRPHGFAGGAMNTAGLLSGYTPARGTAAAWSDEPPTALVTADPPTRLAASGTAGGVAPRPRRDPAVLVGLGGVAAAMAVVGTVFLWPAPRTTNSAVSRPLTPAAPVVTAVEPEPTTSLSITTTVEPTPTRRARPAAPVRTRRTLVEPTPVPVAETTVPPSVTPEPTVPTTTSAPPESTAPPPTAPSETIEPTSPE